MEGGDCPLRANGGSAVAPALHAHGKLTEDFARHTLPTVARRNRAGRSGPDAQRAVLGAIAQGGTHAADEGSPAGHAWILGPCAALPCSAHRGQRFSVSAATAHPTHRHSRGRHGTAGRGRRSSGARDERNEHAQRHNQMARAILSAYPHAERLGNKKQRQNGPNH